MNARGFCVTALLLAVSTHAQAASFSCAKAASNIERTICADSELSRLDVQLAAAFRRAVSDSPDPSGVRETQRAWLKARDACADVPCLVDVYNRRINELENPSRQNVVPAEQNVASAPPSTLDADCAGLDAAVKAALDANVPAASMTRFGGRLVTGWRATDYDAFLQALGACSNRADVAPVLDAFPRESRDLLMTLRQRAVEIASPPRPATSLPVVPTSPPRTAFPASSPVSEPVASVPATSTSVGTPAPRPDGRGRTKAEPAQSSNNTSAPAPRGAANDGPPSRDGTPLKAGQPAGATKEVHTDGIPIVAITFLVWLLLVIAGIVAGWNKTIVVFRNFDDLAIEFVMGVVVILGGLLGFYFSGAQDKSITVLVWGTTAACVMILFGWTLARTWRDQHPRSLWRFGLALVTKISLGILFVNNLWTLLSPPGKTIAERARNKASALTTLAVLTPIVLRLVRDHEGVWTPHNLLSAYHRRRVGVS